MLESEGSESDLSAVGCCEYGNEPLFSTDVGDPLALGKIRWEAVTSVESAGSLDRPV